MKSNTVKYHGLLLAWHWLALVGLVLLGWIGYRHFSGLPWVEVRVYADCQQVTKDELKRLVVSQLQRGMIGDSLTGLKQELVGNPWVKWLRITRSWPGVLQIDITERQPVAIWLDKELVDGDDQRISIAFAKQPLPILPHLVGSEQRFKYVLETYKKLLPMLSKQNWQITNMEWHRGDYWKIRLAIGTELFFIDKNLTQQFARFIALYPQILQQQGDIPQYIDFRYNNGNFAVK